MQDLISLTRDWTQVPCSGSRDSTTGPPGKSLINIFISMPVLVYPWNSPGKDTGVGSHSHLQSIFPSQGSNPGLPHCGRVLYWLSHQKAQEYWSGQPFPSPGDLPDPGIKPGSPCRWGELQANSLSFFFANSLSAELPGKHYLCPYVLMIYF